MAPNTLDTFLRRDRPGSELHPRLAGAYARFLRGIDWADSLVRDGAEEGIRKFLSNAYLSLFPYKHVSSHLVSEAALEVLRANHRHPSGLVWEHVVPKKAALQDACETDAAAGLLNESEIVELLDRYWLLASITKDEDRQLPTALVEHGEVLGRYKVADITLFPNPFFVEALPHALARAGVRQRYG